MCDICKVDGILAKHFGDDLSRSIGIGRVIEDGEHKGFVLSAGGVFLYEARSEQEDLEDAFTAIEAWSEDSAKKVFEAMAAEDG